MIMRSFIAAGVAFIIIILVKTLVGMGGQRQGGDVGGRTGHYATS
jgi:hypothetical protein